MGGVHIPPTQSGENINMKYNNGVAYTTAGNTHNHYVSGPDCIILSLQNYEVHNKQHLWFKLKIWMVKIINSRPSYQV